MIQVPWNCPDCAAANVSVVSYMREFTAGAEFKAAALDRCRNCRRLYKVMTVVEIKATIVNIEQAAEAGIGG